MVGLNSGGGTSTLTVSGTGSATVTTLQLSAATAIVNLDGGTLTANQIIDVDNSGVTANSNTTFNFNGGTLTADTGAVTAFMTGLSNAYVKSGGANIKTDVAITIGQNLLDFTTPSGGGLTKSGSGTLTLSGTNTYTGITLISAGKIAMGNASALQNSAFDTASVNGGLDVTGYPSLTLGGLTGSVDLSSTLITGYDSVTGLVLNPQTGITRTYSGIVSNGSGAMTLTKSGAGTQVLSGTNSYTGGTTVSAGVLLATKAAALPGYNSNGIDKVTFNGGTVGVQVGGSGWTTGDVDTLLGNATKTSGALGIDTTNGDLTQWVAFTTANLGSSLGLGKLGSGTLTLDTANSYTGATTITNGTLQVGASGAIPSGSGMGNVVFDSAPNTAIVDLNGNDVSINGLSQTNNSTTNRVVNNATSTSKTLTVGNADATSTFAGIIADNTGTGGTLALTKTGAGTLTLSGVNTYTGGTTVNAGTLSLPGSTGNGRIRGVMTVNANGTVVTTGDGTGLGYNNQMTSLVIDGGLLKASASDGHIWNLTGGVSMTGGELQTNAGLSSPTGNAFQWNRTALTTNASANTAVISGRINLRGDSGYANWAVSVADGTAAADLLVSAAITNSNGVVGLTKSGAGTMVLSGTNSYTGATTVNSGTLAVDGSLAAGSAVAVGGASATGTPTLSGIGTVNGTVTINAASGGAAGTLNPGTVGATGTLSTGAATLNGTLTIDINGAALDQLTVNGNLDLTGSSLAVNELAAPTAGPHTVVTYSGTLSTTFASIPPGYTVNYGSGTNDIITLTKSTSDYDTWGAPYGLTTGSEGGDLDGDGVKNQAEYAFGLIPNSGSSVNPITSPLNKATGKFSYTRRATPASTGLTYTVWTSVDLVTWTLDSTATSSQTVTGTAGEVQTVEATIPGTLPLTQSKLFIQVRAN